MTRSTHAWLFLALLAASIDPIVVKFGYRAEATPWQLFVIKSIVGAAVVWPIRGALARTERAARTLGPRARIGKIAIVGTLLLFTILLSLLALTRLSAVTFMTVIATTPALVALVSERRGKVRLGLSFWGGFGLAFLGVLLTINAFEPGALRGDLVGLALVAGAITTSAVYRSSLDDLTQEVSPRDISTWVFVLHGVAALVFFVPWVGAPPQKAWGLGAFMGLTGVVANFAFVEALARVGAARLSVFTLLQRPLVMVIAAMVLHEPMGALQIAGVLAVLVGVRLARPRAAVVTPIAGK